MFLPTSRYARVEQVEATAAGGRPVLALKLRRLPVVAGDPYLVKDNDRLDLLAQDRYGDGTMFWHIADANTALEANDLVGQAGDTLNLPRS